MNSSLFNHFISDFRDIKYYFCLLKYYALMLKGKFDERFFKTSISLYLSQKSEEFYSHLSLIFISNKGTIRHAASRIILNELTKNKQINWNIDCTNLTKEEQHRLLASASIYLVQPDYILSQILPLKSSKFEAIRTLLEAKLEELVFSFGGKTIEFIENKLDLSKNEDSTIFDRLKKYHEAQLKFTHKKLKILEFSPQVNQNRRVNNFLSEQFYHYTKNVREIALSQSVFMQYVKKVSISKGTGWKANSSSPVSNFTELKSSTSIPIDYIISPDEYNYELAHMKFENWK